MRFALTLMVGSARVLFRSRLEVMVENLALRQQLAVFKQKRPRPRLGPTDRMFWVFLRRAWRNWANALIVVKPDTVVSWQRQGFQLFCSSAGMSDFVLGFDGGARRVPW